MKANIARCLKWRDSVRDKDLGSVNIWALHERQTLEAWERLRLTGDARTPEQIAKRNAYELEHNIPSSVMGTLTYPRDNQPYRELSDQGWFSWGRSK